MSQAVAIFDRRPSLVYCNKAASELLALPPELTQPGTPWWRIMEHQVAKGAMPPGAIPKMLRNLRIKPEHREEYRDSSGKIVSVRRDPLEDGGFVVLYNDVTVQREAEAALQESERRYHAIVENQTDLIARYGRDGAITFVNEAFCRFYGMSRDEIIGRNMLDFAHDADRAAVSARFRERRGKAAIQIEYRATATSDGLPCWLNRIDRPIFGVRGRIVEYLSVMRDVTELKRAVEHAQRVGKLTTLGQIVAGVTHELNQPLNAAGMAAQNALLEIEHRGAVDAAYITRKLESFVDSVRMMGKIVNHLRSFIRSPNDSDPVAVPAEVVARAVELMAQQLEALGIRISARAPVDCSRIAAAPIDLEIALVNLFTNARDAIARRRAIEREGGKRETKGRISLVVRPSRDSTHILFHVRDNGGGIAADLIPHVFDPFVTTKEVGEGTGLGLALVQQTAANFGGAVEARNTKSGAEFTISVPVEKKP